LSIIPVRITLLQKPAFADENAAPLGFLRNCKIFAVQLLDRNETKNKKALQSPFDFRLRIEFLSSLIQKRMLQRHSNLTLFGGKAFEFKFSTFSLQ